MILKILLSVIFGGIFTQIINKLRHRTSILNWEKSYQRLATSSINPDWGDLKVLYNDHEQSNLSYVTIKIENGSHRDLVNLEINLQCRDESWILLSSGFYNENNRIINFTDEFSKLLTDSKEDNLNYITENRTYAIPVLNRGSSLTFDLLISSTYDIEPDIKPTCIHKSVKLRYSKPKQKLLGEDQIISAIIGLLMVIIITFY